MRECVLSPVCLIVGANEKERESYVKELSGLFSFSLSNPDFFLLYSEESIGIDEVRSLQKSLSFKPFGEGKKIAFIKEAQKLTIEAQNALLKTLEEPPAHTQIFLSTPQTSWLLPTIVSRCQIIALPQKSALELTEEEEEVLQKFLKKLISSSIPQRFILLEKEMLTKDRQTALTWIEKTVVALHQEMKLPTILPALNRAGSYLTANCNVRLTLEVFLLDLQNSQPRGLTR